MVNPQTTNGYTPICNELLEIIYSTPLNATQLKIIMVLCRYTYGFSRKEHSLSEKFISKAIKISKRYISLELNNLIDKKIITVVKPHTDISPKILALNKHYDEWHGRTILPQVNNISTSEEQINTTVEEQINTTVEELFYQDKQNLKQNIKQEVEEFFETVWKLYPKKEGKGQVSDTQKQKLYKIGYPLMKSYIEAYVNAKNGTDKKYLQNGSTFFNSGYVDYLDEEPEKTKSKYQSF